MVSVATFPPVTASAVVELLRARYSGPAWAFMEQVGDATGAYTQRHADAIAMSLWPSRGLELIGFEVKVSRNDWRRELAKPDKAEPIASRLDRFYVVAPADVVGMDTVPPAWGLLEVLGGKKLIERKKAERLDPEPLDRAFLAAILRRASAVSPTLQMRAEARKAAIAETEAELESRVRLRTGELQSELDVLRRSVEQFEECTGIPLEKHEADGHYGFPSGAELGKAVVFLAHGGVERVQTHLRSLDHTIAALKRIADEAGPLFEEETVSPAEGVAWTPR